ncbi:asparagine synthase-related protein [Streptomyces klenkii]|uniref:asparagine synthase-related protein n=1 Tax=Streptomyces klenkii TaxID=1420899 RepID=UPI0033BB9305
MSGCGARWFAVLPDSEAGSTAAGLLRPLAARSVQHASGRPWLLGHWSAGEVVVGRAGSARLAVIGQCPVTAGRLNRLAAGLGTGVAYLDRIGAVLPGSFHAVAAAGGRLRVQGSASGLRRVFFAPLAGTVVAADRSDVLARLMGSGPDRQWLAARLLDQPVPHPAADAPPWQGVRAVPPGRCLLIEADGRSRTARWWYPPEPELPLSRGAPLLRDALATAVAFRVEAAGATGAAGTAGMTGPAPGIGCDLSGGLDSSSLCFLAHRHRPVLTALTCAGVDESDDDAAWADLAARDLPGARRLVVSAGQRPPQFADLLRSAGTDEPNPGLRGQAQVLALSGLLAAEGCRVRLSGHGGDEVVWARHAYLHDLARSHPRTCRRHARAHRILRRWSGRSVLDMLLDRRDYGTWLGDQAAALTSPPGRDGPAGWGPDLRMVPWATAEAAEAARALLGAAAEDARPLAGSRGRHEAVVLAQTAGRCSRIDGQVVAGTGLTAAYPFLDDRVLEACLAVRLHERTTPWHYKPLLTEAMRGIVPDAVLRRTTKADTGTEVSAGFRRHRGELLALCDDLLLARYGLADAARLRAAVAGACTEGVVRPALVQTLATEAWLRSAGRTGMARAPGVAGPGTVRA